MGSNMMTLPHVKTRSSQGCWTCRLRRKKCDETKPICSVCAALEITCHYSNAKPEWMDGDELEKAKADELKAMVKAKANERRERNWIQPLAAVSVSESEEPVRATVVAAATSAANENHNDDSMLSLSMRTGMALGSSSDNTDHEMSGTSSETGPSSVSSYNATAVSSHQEPSPPPPPPPQHDPTPLAPRLTFFAPFAAPEAYETGAAVGQPLNWPSPFTTEPRNADPTISFDESFERDMHSVMIYLDYVLPFRFPFYRPSLAESGRGWLLVLLMRNKALFHTALSLASFFFSVALEERDRHYKQQQQNVGSSNQNNIDNDISTCDGGFEFRRTACQEANWNELQTHTELAIQQLQRDMQDLNARGIAATPLMEGVRCLESIIQLLQQESAITDTADASENWPVHLDAAITLFQELIAYHADTTTTIDGSHLHGDSDEATIGPWTSIFRRMRGPSLEALFSRDPGRHRHGPFSSDQSAFRFYTAYLVWADVVASTAREEAPRLQQFHGELLGAGEDEFQPLPAQLALEDYVGCQSWAVRLLGEVAAIAAWKKERRAAGSLSVVELVQRALCIERRLRGGIAELEADGSAPSFSSRPPILAADPLNHSSSSSSSSAESRDVFSPFLNPPTQPPPLDRNCKSSMAAASLAVLQTRIWAHATLAYLAIIVHGLQPSLPEIAGPAAATLALLRALVARPGGDGPLELRTLAWPFAVAGCCAGEGGGEGGGGGDRVFFVDAVAGMGAMCVFGAVGEALAVVQRVWALHDGGALDSESWDVAACLGVLGRRVLLV